MRGAICFLLLLMFILGCGHQQQIKTISKSQSPKVSSYINGDQQVQTILTLKWAKKRHALANRSISKHSSNTSDLPARIDKSTKDDHPAKKDSITTLQHETTHLIDAPLIKQLPELARGCEVTSLAMLLQDAGISVDKMTLAKQIKKDPTPYQVVDGKVHFGNPNIGFVGDIYSFKKPGYGVYHGPVYDLAKKYLSDRVIDLTGKGFAAVKNQIDHGLPVWVITTSWFRYVPDKEWETWYTESGPIRITMHEHAVLITGYDKEFIYFNDPLSGIKNRKVAKNDFLAGWKQFGEQAISFQLKS